MGSVRATSTRTTSASGNGVGDKPAGTASGDILIACVSSSLTASITPPTGWVACPSSSQKTFSQNNAVSNGCGIFILKAGGAEPSTYTWTGTSREWIIDIIALQGITVPLLKSDGTIVPESLVDEICIMSRSGSSIAIADEPVFSDLTWDHYFAIAAFAVQDAGNTRTLSAPSAYLTQIAANALVGVSQLSAYAEITVQDSGDNPTIGPTSCTLSAASGNGRNYMVLIADPLAVITSKARRGRPAGRGPQ